MSTVTSRLRFDDIAEASRSLLVGSIEQSSGFERKWSPPIALGHSVSPTAGLFRKEPITIEHASRRAGAPEFTYEKIGVRA
jgi:hypothetical protein